MIKEYGGFLPLELREKNELFDTYKEAKVARFNSGRASIIVAIKSVQPAKIYIPYYNCSVVRDALTNAGIEYEYYYLDENLEPNIENLNIDEWIIYVHYFGIFPVDKIQKIAKKYKNVIFDNTQAFFSPPVLDGKCLNVYSPRKFVGLIDGGYLVWSGSKEISEDYPRDISWERGGFLLKSIELGTNAAYKDNLDSKMHLNSGIKRMSVLTEKMLKSLDYEYIAKKRNQNYRILIDKFKEKNLLKLPMEGFAPFVYPLVIEDSYLRNKIVEKKIYVPQWWKYLLNEISPDSVEAWLSQWLLPLPIDHRYSEQDIEDMASIILNLL